MFKDANSDDIFTLNDSDEIPSMKILILKILKIIF